MKTEINLDDKLTASLCVILSIPFSNNSYYQYLIYCECFHEAIELYFDYAIEHDKELDRDLKCALTLSDEDIHEFRLEYCIDDHITFDGVNYLSDILMKDCFEVTENKFKECV
tara:strand:- start:156 stop:494 length:339 start_codon:yes stop_codon:yes gene_type:complete